MGWHGTAKASLGKKPSGIAAIALAFFAILTSSAAAATWTDHQLPSVGQSPLYDISCPSTSLCVAVGGGNTLASSANPTGPAGNWSVIYPGGAGPPNQSGIKGVSCPSPQLCVVVSFEGLVLTSTNPTGGPAAWTFTNLIPYTRTFGTTVSNAMWGASCPTVTFCAIAAGDGQVFTSEDPFATSPTPVKNGVKKKHKRRRKGPKHPQTTLARRPFRAIELSGRKLTVRLGFFATKHAPVRGFVCKIDKRPQVRCHSPKRYRVGACRHR